MHRICFATPLVRPLLDPSFVGDFGGAEVRALTFARGLARYDEFDVAMLLNAYTAGGPERYGNLQACYWRQPMPLTRARDLLRDRWYYGKCAMVVVRKLVRSLQKRRERMMAVRPRPIRSLAASHADIYCTFGVHHHAANVVATAKSLDRQCLLFLASDTDLDVRYLSGSDVTNDYGQRASMCRFALEQADGIVVQTETQRELLASRFHRVASLIRNPIDLTGVPTVGPVVSEQPFVLWVGRADTFSKRADTCLELARRCPQVRFVVILNKRNTRLFEQFLAGRPPNVEIIERVPFGEIEDYFQRASVLINTSDAEGFPNAFLQAAKHGVPIVSLNVDPDDMLSRHGCGACAEGDLGCMAHLVEAFWSDRARHQVASQRATDYVRRYHEVEGRVRELRLALLEMAASPSGRDRRAA